MMHHTAYEVVISWKLQEKQEKDVEKKIKIKVTFQ